MTVQQPQHDQQEQERSLPVQNNKATPGGNKAEQGQAVNGPAQRPMQGQAPAPVPPSMPMPPVASNMGSLFRPPNPDKPASYAASK